MENTLNDWNSSINLFSSISELYSEYLLEIYNSK